jgi:hypothetical protein
MHMEQLVHVDPASVIQRLYNPKSERSPIHGIDLRVLDLPFFLPFVLVEESLANKTIVGQQQ